MLCGSNADGDGVGEMELAVNNCFPNCAHSSDWAVAEVIVWNRALDLDEGISVQEYLRFRRFVPPTPAPQHTPEDDAHKRAEDPDPPWAAHTSLGAPGGGLYRHISGAVVTDAGVGASDASARRPRISLARGSAAPVLVGGTLTGGPGVILPGQRRASSLPSRKVSA